jgi:hypothetical protein
MTQLTLDSSCLYHLGTDRTGNISNSFTLALSCYHLDLVENAIPFLFYGHYQATVVVQLPILWSLPNKVFICNNIYIYIHTSRSLEALGYRLDHCGLGVRVFFITSRIWSQDVQSDPITFLYVFMACCLTKSRDFAPTCSTNVKWGLILQEKNTNFWWNIGFSCQQLTKITVIHMAQWVTTDGYFPIFGIQQPSYTASYPWRR